MRSCWLNSLQLKSDEITSSHVNTLQPTKEQVGPEDHVGLALVELFAAMRASHPAYLEVFAGTKGGFVSDLQDSDMPVATTRVSGCSTPGPLPQRTGNFSPRRTCLLQRKL